MNHWHNSHRRENTQVNILPHTLCLSLTICHSLSQICLNTDSWQPRYGHCFGFVHEGGNPTNVVGLQDSITRQPSKDSSLQKVWGQSKSRHHRPFFIYFFINLSPAVFLTKTGMFRLKRPSSTFPLSLANAFHCKNIRALINRGAWERFINCYSTQPF